MQRKEHKIFINGLERKAEHDALISDLLEIELLCAGNGNCGKCRVVATGELSALSSAEKRLLSAEDIERGVRLACSARVRGECKITLSEQHKKQSIATDSTIHPSALLPVFSRLGVAVDIGTTTLAAHLYSSDGRLIAQASALNPQIQFGADVISRIKASLEGNSARLSRLIKEAVDNLIYELCRKAEQNTDDVEALVITGNTAMLYLLTESSPISLSRAPFKADRLFGEQTSADALGLASLCSFAKIYLPPCISAFVGADTVCAILACELYGQPKTQLMADIGTNGEIALWSNGELHVCSTAAGPAFEGVGISSGMRGESGAIDRVAIINGALSAHVLGEVEPRGICGSGLVDALACSLDIEAIDESGYIEDGEITVARGVKLLQADVRALQLAKGAISAGISTLLCIQGIKPQELDTLFIAGGFGAHLDIRNAIRIGLIPNITQSKIQSVGNAALAGASALLLNGALKEKATEIAASAKLTELASNPIFAEAYMSAMMF